MKIKSIFLQFPAWLLITSSFLASLYAAYNNISGVNYSTPLILLVIIVLYIIGRIVDKN